MNKCILLFICCFIGACSSTSEQKKTRPRAALPKATPVTTTEEIKFPDNKTSPTSLEGAQSKTRDTRPKASCNTPLGTIQHGEKATGYLEATVSEDGICISDTLTCNDGVWSGKAIHPKCKKRK